MASLSRCSGSFADSIFPHEATGALSMNGLRVEQAVFTSSNRDRMKGYQSVAKSAGIDRRLSQEIGRWAPTRNSSENPDAWTLNCYPLANDFFAITRTTLGGPEYSGRGGTQVDTVILALRNEQLEPYRFNAVTLCRTAMRCLKLPLDRSRTRKI